MKKYVLNEPSGEIRTHIDFKGDLNEQQYEVVTSADGPCLVLAGAGSGKTRTLIYRLAYLLEKGVPPHNILLMTFTNKAAREMRERTERLLGYEPRGLWSGTFHHIGNRTLRMYAAEAGYMRDFSILDEQDSRDLIKICVKDIRKKDKEEKFPKASVLQAIISLSSNTKNGIGDILDERYPYFLKFAGDIEKIKDRYRKRKTGSGNMDYDDLLCKWKWLLENVPEVRERFTGQFRYVMVDEYQDTNYIQADIINILCERHRNILVVGDDAQSIYSFRGARVENILKFPERFTGARIFKLETNYRSTPEVLKLANDSLSNNLNQFEKTLKAVNPPEEMPALVKVRDPYSQARFVVQRVKEMRGEGIGIKDMAVLFRAHYQSAELEMELVKQGIPYLVRGGIRFFEQAHIKDIVAYLKVLTNPADEVAWVRALTLCPGIGPGYAAKIYDAFRKKCLGLGEFLAGGVSGVVSQKARQGFVRFRGIMEAILEEGGRLAPPEMISRVLDSGYETHVCAAFDNAKDRLDDIHELINFSHGYESVSDFLSDITLREGFKGENAAGADADEEYLVLSTIHQAKGLEWDVVMVIGLCEGQFPHSKSGEGTQEREEERRLFYVAATRARKYLYLVYPASRYDYQQGMVVSHPSVFIEELDPGDYEIWEVDSFSGPGTARREYPDEDKDPDYDDCDEIEL
ncbi:MAG: ATP-dependent helicase [Candidatus Omnitrophota bacterium]